MVDNQTDLKMINRVSMRAWLLGKRWMWGALVISGLMLSACVTSVPTHYYALQDGRSLSPTPVDAKQSIGVAAIVLPRLLNRPQLVLRASDSELVFEEQYQWGGRLQEEIQQLLIDEWQRLAPQQLFYAYPDMAQAMTTEVRSVDIIQMDGQLGKQVQLQAVCRSRDPNTRQLLWQKNISLFESMNTQLMTDYVSSLRTLIRRLAFECR